MIRNARLQNLFKLSSKITILVPATNLKNIAIDNTVYVDNTLKILSEFFGGATSTVAVGSWISSDVGLIKEATTVVFSYCKEADLQKHMNEIIDYCESLKKELSQEAIALEINGEMYFI